MYSFVVILTNSYPCASHPEVQGFRYWNGQDKDAFNDRLDFTKSLIAYEGNDDWVAATLLAIYECLSKDNLPEPSDECDFCNYRKRVENLVF